jgi:hypothetical protein
MNDRIGRTNRGLTKEDAVNHQAEPGNSLVISYLALRRLIGMLGMAMPLVLASGAWILQNAAIQGSISDYYHTPMRDVFVGILCAIGVFMFSYRGYREDRLPGIIAGLAAIGVALFPVAPAGTTDPVVQGVGVVHYIFAASFFLLLAYFSLYLFTKTDPKVPMTARKRQRNVIYRICGLAILAALVLIAGIGLLPESVGVPVKQHAAVFWLEALAVVAFGFSWWVKGEALLADEA